MNEIQYKVYTGPEIPETLFQAAAKFRLKHFYEFPYLYDGTVEIEEEYLKSYRLDPKTIFISANDGDSIIGILTGLPLSSDAPITEELQKKYQNPKSYFYLGDCIVDNSYRGRGIGRELVKLIESNSKGLGFENLTFLTVFRDKIDPRRPPKYKPNDSFWESMGYQKHNETISYDWRTIQENGSIEETSNLMNFWSNKKDQL